jgi:FkbM family methyltransferase
MTLAERIEREILDGEPRTVVGRARLKAAIEARKALVRLGDPIVRHRIGAIDLELPLSHQLPFYRHDHPEYDRPLARVARDLGGAVVDVGANVGDTAAAIREASDVPILCIEGDDRFFALLSRNATRLGDVELEHAFVDAPARATVRRGAGTARLEPGTGEVRTKALSEVIDDHPRFSRPALLKLDTDGMDLVILRANVDFLARARPVVFFEYDPHLGAEPTIFQLLRDAGYRRAEWFENTGTIARTVELPAHLHERYVGHGGARYADVCVRP